MSNYLAWTISPAGYPASGRIQEKVAFLCRYGALAPSVHNVQPWHFQINGEHLRLELASDRKLEAGDPTGREGWISIGACIENIVIAGEYFGLKANEIGRNETSVTFAFSETEPKSEAKSLLSSVSNRASNRAPFTARSISAEILDEIEAVNFSGVTIVATANEKLKELVADLTARAIGMALSNPAFREELSQLIHPNWTKKPIGMPGFTLGVRGPRSLIEKRIVKSGTRAGRQALKELRMMRESAALILVFAEGDSQPYWLSAGRAYERAALIATMHELSSSTSAAAVEAADFHLDIEKFCKTDRRLQTVMRIGYSPNPPRHSPRLGIEKLVTISS